MNEPTLILSPRFHADSQDLWRAAVARGWNVHRAIRYQPPDGTSRCCVYGEILVCDIMADRCDLGLLDPPDGWLAALSQHWTKRDVIACKAAELRAFKQKMFFKPANDKVFQYGVYETGADVPLRYVDPECPCLVSEVVEFNAEVRIYVLDGEPVTWEYYRLFAEFTEDEAREQAAVFAREVLADQADNLPSAVVLDIGHIQGRGWAVVEANQAYASGIYGQSDTQKILDVVMRSAGPMASVSERDRRFLRQMTGDSNG